MLVSQKKAILYAYADLVGSYQSCYDNNCLEATGHDWDAHLQSIYDLEKEFPFIIPIRDDRFPDYKPEED